MSKKIFSILLALAMMLSLAACGKKEEAPAEKPSEAPVEQPAAPGSSGPSEPAAKEPAEENVTMRVAAMTGPTGMGLVKLMSEA